MAIILDGTNGISTPDLEPTGSTVPTNGLYLPAANSVGIATNSSERVRVNSSGNVGIGTSPNKRLTVYSDDGYIQMLNASTGTGNTDGSFIGVEGGTTALRIVNQENDVISFHTNGLANERGRFDASGNFQFNSGYGSVATAYGCRAWVNFNGTGAVAIRASGNVSSITDVNTGNYRVNFTNAMPDTNYSAVFGGGSAFNQYGDNFGFASTVSYVTMYCRNTNAVLADAEIINTAVFR